MRRVPEGPVCSSPHQPPGHALLRTSYPVPRSLESAAAFAENLGWSFDRQGDPVPECQGFSMGDWLPYLNAVWRVPVILLMTGVMSTLSVILSLFDGTGRLQHGCARRWADFILWVSRVRVQAEGMEQLQPGRGYVFMANHLSMFDIWAFLHLLPFPFRFVAKASLFRVPFLGWHLRRSGNVPVSREHPRQTLRLYESIAGNVAAGMSYVVYPEGARTWDGSPGPFRRGAFLLPKHAQAPIVPVTIIGAHRRLKRGSVVIHPGTMQMIFHRPLEYEEYRHWSLDELAERVRNTVLKRYELI
mgnify:FL=1